VSLAAERPLQEGSNVLEQELRAFTAPLSDRAVAVTVPDECASIGVFSFDTLAGRHEERESVIRWRFQQEADVKLGGEQLVYRLFPGEKSVSVLAAAIHESVLKQYLALFDAARLLPVSIGFETFQVFDTFHESIEPGPERFFVHYNGQTLTLLALQHGRPVFLRKRRLTASGSHVHNELIATLQYFDDRFFRVRTEETAAKLYFVDTSHTSASADRPFGSRTTVTIPAVNRARSVEVIPLDWDALRVNRGKAEVSNALLPVIAGIGIA
jgi:hypothetical protein